MSDRVPRISWQSLSLEEFFAHANWQGVIEQQYLSQSGIQAKSLSSWQCWTVEELFSNANWQGGDLTNQASQTNGSAFSLTLQVDKLFRCFVWTGKPKIAALPQLDSEKSVNNAQIPNQTMNLNNLSELF